MGRPSVGIVGGVVCVATDLLFAETVWLPIDVIPLQTLGGGDIIPLQTFGGGSCRRSPTTTTKGETAQGCDSHEVALPWCLTGCSCLKMKPKKMAKKLGL